MAASAASRPPHATEPMPSSTDPDTCRICRGEGTAEEPLFYPCKCSGSIKYVHQDCLMEWLSHSQKKHCELCKTPFRFTKLYAPDMPKEVPFFVFISHMGKYLLKNVLVWLRAVLVASVWLGWLPYSMRSVWSFIFWISDQGLSGGSILFASQNATAAVHERTVSLPSYGAPVCPSSPLFASTTTTAAIGTAFDRIPLETVPQLLRRLYGLNRTGSDPLSSAILRLLFRNLASTEKVASAYNTTAADLDGAVAASPKHHSLLSQVDFLQNLTRHPAVNRTVIAILEGQIITILIIICFILVILVRDYVVQQQPELNMRAAFAAENPPQAPAVQPDPDLDLEVAVGLRGPDTSEDEDEDDDQGHREENGYDEDGGLANDDRTLYQDGEEGGGNDDNGKEDDSQDDNAQPRLERHISRQSLPDNQAPQSSSMAEARTTPDTAVDQPSPFDDDGTAHGVDRSEFPSSEGPLVREYLRLYRLAGGDPEKISDMARKEGLEDKLEFWINVTRTVRDRKRLSEGFGTEDGEPSESVAGISMETNGGGEGQPFSPASSPHWAWREDQDRHAAARNVEDKGKRKADDEEPPFATTSRPRANTDGPKIRDAVNPLGNNSWSFEGLGPEPTERSHGLSGSPNTSMPRESETNAGGLDIPVLGVENGPHSLNDSGSAASQDEDGREHADRLSDVDVETRHAAQAAGPESPVATPTEAQPDPSLHHNEPRPAPQPPGGLFDRVAHFMFRDLDNIDPAELEEEGDFSDDEEDILADGRILAQGPHDHDGADENAAAAEALAEEAEAGLAMILDGVVPGREGMGEDMDAAFAADAEAIEDAEDFEGIMELLGMRGPIAGLFQNAIFCSFLVSVTIFVGIFVPYNLGRVAIWTVADPSRPARLMFAVSKFVQDLALLLVGSLAISLSYTCYLAGDLMGENGLARTAVSVLGASLDMTAGAAARIIDGFKSDIPILSVAEMQNFSAVSHEALLTVKAFLAGIFSTVVRAGASLAEGRFPLGAAEAFTLAGSAASTVWHAVQSLPGFLSHPERWVINLTFAESVVTADPELAFWSGTDRFWAIFAGYVALFLTALLYLQRGAPLVTGRAGHDWEASLIDVLHQASGVMKVILIIGIEMLVFPLYCGMLLDVALLPLFEGTTLKSRLLFTVNYPLTSVFVHWFVGTGYMFHFALFVSMCRKIMRKGVLYFIRDPDDPEFHPIRDVLERSVTTQLRKILFSAFVYAALVMVCLGGVVWGLYYAIPNVLPIHYSSNEPVLEFPIDLLFYNFLMPLAVRWFRPSDRLHAMYTWWFRKCARALRMTWFLFGERQIDEEGTLQLRDGPEQRNLHWWQRLFLEVDRDGQVVPKTWRDFFRGGTAKPTSSIPAGKMIAMNARKSKLVESGQLIPDGVFVRAPASDQVRLSKDQYVFLRVSEQNTRLDGRPDQPSTDLYSTNQYQLVYIPPRFRLRVALFILFIWLFAAVTGVGLTIVPLIFGRQVFKMLIPANIRTNDIYAFSIGIYLLGTLLYPLSHARSIFRTCRTWLSAKLQSASKRSIMERSGRMALRVAKHVYAYFFVLVVFPLLLSSLVELYILIPLNTYMYSPTPALRAALTRNNPTTMMAVSELVPPHSIRVIQSWTIGVLYLKLAARVLSRWYPDSRPAAALRAVARRGWFDLDVSLLTRAFVVPGLALWLLAVALPLLVVRIGIPYLTSATLSAVAYTTNANTRNAEQQQARQQSPFTWPGRDEYDARLADVITVLAYRFSFPAMAWSLLVLAGMWNMVGVFRGWKARIRDEAYLIGERLHNFGPPGTTAGAGVGGAAAGANRRNLRAVPRQ